MLNHVNFRNKDEIFNFIGEQKYKHCFIVFKSDDSNGACVNNWFILKDKKIILMSFGKEENTIEGERSISEMIHICLIHKYTKAYYCNIMEDIPFRKIVESYDNKFGTDTKFMIKYIK